jgi:hypothetical protein
MPVSVGGHLQEAKKKRDFTLNLNIDNAEHRDIHSTIRK